MQKKALQGPSPLQIMSAANTGTRKTERDEAYQVAEPAVDDTKVVSHINIDAYVCYCSAYYHDNKLEVFLITRFESFICNDLVYMLS